MIKSLFLTGFLSFSLLACSVVSPTVGGPTGTTPDPATSAPKPIKALKVTEVWGEFNVFGGLIHFELVPTSKAERGVVCKLEMWSGAKLYETKSVTLRPNHFKRGQTLEVAFQVDAQDKIMALIEGDEPMRNLVDLKTECLPPPPTPTPIPIPTNTPTVPPTLTVPPTPTVPPTLTPTPTPTPFPTPTLSPDRPKIIFISDRDENLDDSWRTFEIYVMNDNGHGDTKLTDFNSYSGPSTQPFTFRGSPSLSPDGTRVVFSGDDNIYVMNIDGTALTKLTKDREGNLQFTDREPSWSPDSTKIAFRSYRYVAGDPQGRTQIIVMNADGSNQVSISDPSGNSSEPVWSPDGSKIAFVFGGSSVFVVNSDGSDRKGLTIHSTRDPVLSPSWSPDGNRIAYASYKGTTHTQIWVVDPIDPMPTRLTNHKEADNFRQALWSPDGSKILTKSDGGIYVMNADGSGLNMISEGVATSGGSPSWSPDGSKILYASTQDGNEDIFFMNADGSGQTNLTNNPAADWWPSWSPGR